MDNGEQTAPKLEAGKTYRIGGLPYPVTIIEIAAPNVVRFSMAGHKGWDLLDRLQRFVRREVTA